MPPGVSSCTSGFDLLRLPLFHRRDGVEFGPLFPQLRARLCVPALSIWVWLLLCLPGGEGDLSRVPLSSCVIRGWCVLVSCRISFGSHRGISVVRVGEGFGVRLGVVCA